jgi:hypothetical protein
MRKRIVRTVAFVAVAIGVAVSAAEVAGAVSLRSAVTNGVHWE